MVGATGILRPAVGSLAADGQDVLAVARRAEPLERLAAEVDVSTLAVDVAAGAPAGLTADAAVVYAPDAGDDALDALQAHVAGRFVVLLVSARAAPGAEPPAPRPHRVHLQLGWRDDRTWHSPQEVSAAALDVLRTGRDATLGVVRPWPERPH